MVYGLCLWVIWDALNIYHLILISSLINAYFDSWDPEISSIGRWEFSRSTSGSFFDFPAGHVKKKNNSCLVHYYIIWLVVWNSRVVQALSSSAADHCWSLGVCFTSSVPCLVIPWKLAQCTMVDTLMWFALSKSLTQNTMRILWLDVMALPFCLRASLAMSFTVLPSSGALWNNNFRFLSSLRFVTLLFWDTENHHGMLSCQWWTFALDSVA